MARVQTPEYQQRVAALSAVTAPQIQAEQHAADPNASGAFQLARALGAADFSPAMKGLADDQKKKDEAAATAYANSMTIDELGKKIKNKELLPSQSPVYVATVQNLYGQNSMNRIESDTASKIGSGELKFDTPEALDEYLTTARNEHLSGHSQYTVAGFDKGWNKFREVATVANTKLQDKEYQDHAIATASESLSNAITKGEGTVQEQAGVFMSLYGALKDNHVLMTPEARKGALRNSLMAAANSGNKELVDTILSSKLDNGESVSGVIGVDHGISLSNHADQKFRQDAVQRVDTDIRPFVMSADKGLLDMRALDSYVAKNEKFVTTATYHAIVSANERALDRIRQANMDYSRLAAMQDSNAAARSAIQAALSTGTFSRLTQQKVLTKDGGQTDVKQVEVAQEILEQQTAGMPPEERLAVYSRNDVPDPELKKRLLGGVANLATLGWKYDGKNVGALSPVGQASFDEFTRVNKVNPGYTKELIGAKTYETLSQVQDMYALGGSGSLTEAARVVNEANNSGITKEDFDKNYRTSVNSAVDKIYNPEDPQQGSLRRPC